MEATIIYIFGETDCPRYAIGLVSDDNYLVLSPVNEGDNTFEYKKNDTIKIKTISEGPVSATNMTTKKEISVGLCEIGITSEKIREKYYPLFK